MKTITSMICLLLILTPISAQTDLSFGQIWNPVNDEPLFYNIGGAGTWNSTALINDFSLGHLLIDGDTLRYYLGGFDGTRFTIGMWWSTRLDSGWQEYEGNPVLRPTPGAWDSLSIGTPCVLKDGDIYKMWYTGAQGNDSLGRQFRSIGYATSSDGKNWTKHPDPVVPAGYGSDPNFRWARCPSVIRDGDTLKMWFATRYRDPVWEPIEYAYSLDGINWTKPIDGPVLDEGGLPFWLLRSSVKKIGDKYGMWYSRGDGGNPFPLSTHFAISDDGIHWRKDHLYNPVLPRGTSGNWDNMGLSVSDVIEMDGISYAIYGAWSQMASNWGVGLAKYNPSHISGGDVSGNWSKDGSPYFVNGALTIPDGETLTIEPGTTVEFLGHDPLNVQGRLLAEGTDSEMIRFLVRDSLGFHNYAGTDGVWGGIRFDSTAATNDSSILKYCEIAFARTFAGDGGGYALEGKGGGGLSIYKFDKVRVDNCLIQYNQAIGDVAEVHSFGGGINIQQYANPVIVNNLIQHNTAMHLLSDKESQGGGIWVYRYADPLIAGNTIRWNRTSDSGGGIGIWWESDPMIVNNLIVNNHAGLNAPGWGAGGGVSTGWDAVPVLINNTIADNTANWTGGGVYTREGSPVFINTIIGDNKDLSNNGLLGDQVGSAVMSGYTLHFYNSAVENGEQYFYWWNDVKGNVEFEECIEADPFLNDDHTLPPASPVIGGGAIEVTVAGTKYFAPDQDMEGNMRPKPVGSKPDMGCFESREVGPMMVNEWHWIENPSNPVLQRGPSGSWDASTIWSHDVIWDDGMFKMWYAGHAGSSGPWSIGYATSIDGKTWTKYANNPVLEGDVSKWYGTRIWNPRVVKVDTVYHMYFGSSGAKVTGHATSSDGVNWTITADPVLDKGGTVDWDGKQAIAQEIMVDTSGFKMWYAGQDVNNNGAVGYATSDDGINWTKSQSNPVFGPGDAGKWDSDPLFYPSSVVYNGKLYYMFYCGNDGPNYNQIGRAYSVDGKTWYRVTKDAPEVAFGPPGSWNDEACFYPSVVLHGGEYHMWYNGSSTVPGSSWTIGYTRWQYVDVVPDELTQLMPAEFVLMQNYPNPFNPATQIRYTLPENSEVQLVIYDMLGRELTELVNAEQGQGSYEVQWNGLDQNGHKVPTGIYIAQLRAGKNTETIKMLLLK